MGTGWASIRTNSICIADESNVSIYGDMGETQGHRELGWDVVHCDKTKRATCKSREETAAFLSRANFNMDGLRSVVVEDQFSSEVTHSSNYKGDQNTYFPIQSQHKVIMIAPMTVSNYTSS